MRLFIVLPVICAAALPAFAQDTAPLDDVALRQMAQDNFAPIPAAPQPIRKSDI